MQDLEKAKQILIYHIECGSYPEYELNDLKFALSVFSDLIDRCEKAEKQLSCKMGVGDGTGQLFVYGDHDSIKAAQTIVLAKEEWHRRAIKSEAELKELLAVLNGVNHLIVGMRMDTRLPAEARDALGHKSRAIKEAIAKVVQPTT